jgi:hypothetical protein
MLVRDVGRLLSVSLLVGGCGFTVVACGTSNTSEFHDAGRPDDGSIVFNGDASLGDGGNLGSCTPRTCADQNVNCGPAGDGCGAQIDCGTCTAPEFCGGGGYSKCGTTPTALQDGGLHGDGGTVTSCTPGTCESAGANCGWMADGCGNAILCGLAPDGGAMTLAQGTDAGTASASPCPSPQFCGGGGPNKCGGDVTVAPDGGTNSPCVPQGCPAGANCGQAGDGCGNVITCGGSCTNPQFCGGAGANTCGGFNGIAPDGGVASPCTPTTCAALGIDCGPAGDGCGGVLQCGSSCPAPQFCGGGGPGKCGGNVNIGADGGTIHLCQPTTCAAQNIACGQASDGCGNVLQCGSCTAPNTCGGGGVAGQCGHVCTGLCPYQATCSAGATTTITGTVTAAISKWLNPQAPTRVPFPPDPVPNVLVYVPNAALTAVPRGYTAGTCPLCGADVSGQPLVSAYTDFDGTFTLTNVPTPPSNVQTQIPVVIQLGRWRKEFLVNTPPSCQTTSIGTLRLPANQTDGVPASQTGNVNTTNVPLTAISTGSVDALECVLLKMGVDQGEFTANGGTGHIQLYAGGTQPTNGASGATIANATPETTLMNSTSGTYMGYDQLMFPCWGAPVTKPTSELNDLISYADSGGHFFATHYSWSWLVNNGEFNEVASWNTDANNPGSATWGLNVSKVPPAVAPPLHSGIFYQWLNLVGALSNANPGGAPPASPAVNISNPRHDADGVLNGSLDWIDGTDPNLHTHLVEHFTFNTPVHQTTQCGHAIFSDFHVTNANSNGKTFPSECDKNAMTAQERVLEYMIFDLASCVTPPSSNCKPLSCQDQGLSCGVTGDGCGNPLDCGSCVAPLTCGGGGVRGVCGEPDGGACTPSGCNGKCGPQGDGCGGQIACPCPSGTTCGGGGVPNVCGVTEAGTCTPRTCAQAGISCGPAGDGCGNLVAGGCGSCAGGQVCGAAGPGQCGTPEGGACVPLTCADQGITCGPAGDGCGGLIASCGTCNAPQTCGGGGAAGQCGGGECVPYTCADLGYDCGPAGDGCGGLLECGTCTGGTTCGGGGRPGQCGNTIPK